MNRHVLSGANPIVLSGARLSCHQAQRRAQIIDAASGSSFLTLITRSFGSLITPQGRSFSVDALTGTRRGRHPMRTAS